MTITTIAIALTGRLPLAAPWGVSGAEPVSSTMQPAPWQPLVRGLADKAAAESWLFEHARDDMRLVHFLVNDCSISPTAAKAQPDRWECWDRGPDGVVRSARDGRRLDGGVDVSETEARRF